MSTHDPSSGTGSDVSSASTASPTGATAAVPVASSGSTTPKPPTPAGATAAGQQVTLSSWVIFIMLTITWGSSFILMKRGLEAFTPLQVGMLRVLFAGLFILGISFRDLRALNRENAKPLAVVGLVSIVFPYLLFPLSVIHLDSGLVGVLNSLVPLFTLIIGVIWFKSRVTWVATTGILIGLGGALWLLLPGLQVDGDQLLYGSLPIIAGVGYAIGVNTVNRHLGGMKPMEVTVISLAFAVVPAVVMLAATRVDQVFLASPAGWSSLGYIAILGILGTAIANYFFNHLIRTTGSLFSSSVTYAIPVVALMWGFYDGESIGVNEFIGMGLILLGVWLVNTRNRSSAKAAAAIMDVEMAPMAENGLPPADRQEGQGSEQPSEQPSEQHSKPA